MKVNDILIDTVYFGLVISFLCYWIAMQIRKKLPYPIFNPLLISAIIIISILVIFNIDFDTYNKGAQFITMLLTPSTVCLAIPLYKQIKILIKHFDAIIISLLSGCIAGIASIFIICFFMKVEPIIYYSLLPKSITTAIAIGVSDKIGGNSTITVGVVIVKNITKDINYIFLTKKGSINLNSCFLLFINLYSKTYLCVLLFLFATNTIEASANPASEYPKLVLSPVLILAVVSPAFTTLFATTASTLFSGFVTNNPANAFSIASTAVATSSSVAFSFANVACAFANASSTTCHAIISCI